MTLPLLAGLEPDTEARSQPPTTTLIAEPAPETLAATRILVVDDDPAVHRVVGAVFAGENYAVDAARTGEQGLQLAAERSYHVILADARIAAGPSHRFVQALLAASPEAGRSLIVACTADSDVDPLLAPVCRVGNRSIRASFGSKPQSYSKRGRRPERAAGQDRTGKPRSRR